jgi:predicted enzyme related to lactoylglutathione lyase
MVLKWARNSNDGGRNGKEPLSRREIDVMVAPRLFGQGPYGESRSRKQGAGLSDRVMQIHYLEIVTKEVDAVCAAYAAVNGVQFGGPDAGLGNARTAALPGGGLVGVRAPMHETEEPVVRPYWLVDDIEAAVAAAVKAGGEVAHPPMEIPGHGTFAIYIQGGIQHGLWKR